MVERQPPGGIRLQKLPPIGKSRLHRIHEETLNDQAEACAAALRETMQSDMDRVNKLLKQSSLQAPGIQKRIAELKAQTEQLEQEIDEILMEKLR